jgi:phosphatidylserine decarboxylase
LIVASQRYVTVAGAETRTRTGPRCAFIGDRLLIEFLELIDTDPVVRMYIEQMIAQVLDGKSYRNRHLKSVQQLLRLINEVPTTTPEFGAIPDWAMGTPAGFAAFRDPGSTRC